MASKLINSNTSKNYSQRGQFYGPIYDVDHLASFNVGSKHGLLTAEDGMRKLRILEKSKGVWTMECNLMVDSNCLVLFDKKNGQELETFPIDLIHEPTSCMNDDKNDLYNNILLFTVNQDQKKSKFDQSNQTEMHLFQCIDAKSTEIVDEIYKAKNGRDNFNNNNNNNNINNNNSVSKNSDLRKYNQSINGNYLNNQINSLKQNNLVDQEVKLLNSCFDDIERFVTRLQNSSEYYKELEKRQKERKSNKKQVGDGMLKMRAQMPSVEDYVDIFQKIKYSFNLLAKLKSFIHDPNAPELVHFLFTPLALIFNTTKEEPYQGISKTVWKPLITREAKDLLQNCLSSKEQDLWMSLGEAWLITKDEIKLQPNLYSQIDRQPYIPIFYDGTTADLPVQNQFDRVDLSKLAQESAAQAQLNNQKYQQQQQQQQKQRFNPNNNNNNLQINASNLNDQTPYSSNILTNSSAQNRQNSINQSQPQSAQINQKPILSANSQRSSSQTNQKFAQIRNYEEMKKWAIDLRLRGAKVFEVSHDRQGNNDKELTVKSGELVEVLDDKRNWWKIRNFYGLVGHAPVTILRPFDFSDGNNNNMYF